MIPDRVLLLDGDVEVGEVDSTSKPMKYFLFNDMLLLIGPDRSFFNSVVKWKIQDMLQIQDLKINTGLPNQTQLILYHQKSCIVLHFLDQQQKVNVNVSVLYPDING